MPDDSLSTHISSLVVYCLPGRFVAVGEELQQLGELEIGASDPEGKYVVLLETANEHGILDRVREIETIDGVLNAILIYHEIDDSPIGETR